MRRERYNYYTGKNINRITARYYAMRYNIWLEEYNSLKDSVGAIAADGMPHGTNIGDPTGRLAERRVELRQKMELIENTAKESDPDFCKWIMKHAVDGVSYEYMNLNDGLYCSRRCFFRKMNKFYLLLAEKI